MYDAYWCKDQDNHLDVPIHSLPHPLPFYGFQKAIVFSSAKIKKRLLCVRSLYFCWEVLD